MTILDNLRSKVSDDEELLLNFGYGFGYSDGEGDAYGSGFGNGSGDGVGTIYGGDDFRSPWRLSFRRQAPHRGRPRTGQLRPRDDRRQHQPRAARSRVVGGRLSF